MNEGFQWDVSYISDPDSYNASYYYKLGTGRARLLISVVFHS
jgi:hypothetical protein